jgi:ankyrin repeat protein
VTSGALVGTRNPTWGAQDGKTALHLAAEAGSLECLRILLEAGADVDAFNKKGNTALHAACVEGHVACVAALIEGGADLDVHGQDGWTPLHIAAKHGHTGCIRALIEAGATVDVKSWVSSLPRVHTGRMV